jgi:HAMP domain-containing protein
MKDTETEASFGRSNRAPSYPGELFPVFEEITKNLILASLILPLIVIAVCAAILDLPMPIAMFGGLGTFLIAIMGTVLTVRLLTRRIQRPLETLLGSIDRVVAGHYDDQSMVNNAELPNLNASFNQLVTSLVIAKEAMIDRDMLQRVLDGVPDPLVVLDGNGVVELSNQKFNERLQFVDELSVVGKGVGTLSGQNMPAWYMSLIRHGTLEAEPVDFKTTDGKTISLLISGTMIRNPDD